MFRIVNKFRMILSKQQKKRIIIITIMMIFGAFLEMLGVGLIIPLVTAVTTPGIIEENEKVKFICERFDLHSTNTFIILVIVMLIFVYIFKNIYLFLEYYVQCRFICNNRFAVQGQLMEKYLNKPYEFFLYAESGEILRIINTDTSYAFELLNSVLGFFTEAFISIALIAAIIMTDPFMAFLSAAILGISMFAIENIIRPILKKAGLKNLKNSAEVNKWLLQSVNGIKEIKVTGKEKYFLSQFLKFGKRAIESEKINTVLGNVPRLSIEAVSMSAILGVIAILLYIGREIDSLLPQLAAFAFAAVRLMPSVNRMNSALNSMAYREPSLDKLIEILNTENEKIYPEKKVEGDNACITMRKTVKLENIIYTYPKAEEPVLLHANMEIPIGKSIGIVGASGAGKTTAVDILLGLLYPQTGWVLADDVDICKDYNGWLSHISYIPQMIFMLDDTIQANVAFGKSKEDIDEKQVWKALEEAQLADFVRELPEGLNTAIGERGIRLSGGQRQRIGIARALYTDPELLIFDEATSALDNETETAVMESINNLHGKKTLLIIAHRLGTIEGCDMVYRVENGKIIKER